MATPNMNLTLPLVSQTPGPLWASEVNADLAIIDGHDHIATGVPIVSAALNINDDLSFNSHALLDAIKVSFVDGGSNTPNSLQTASGELYFTDGNGNVVQITDNGVVNVGGTGNIGGIVPNAAVNYVSGPNSYEFLDENGNRAALDTGGIQFAGAVTLQQSPYSTSYTLKLPVSAPVANSFVTATVSGSIATLAFSSEAGFVTRTMQAAVGQQVSSTFTASTSSTTPASVSPTLTLACTGRPIMLGLIAAGSSDGSIDLTPTGAGKMLAYLQINVGGATTATIGKARFSIDQAAAPTGSVAYPLGSFNHLYVPSSAGTYTFTIYGSSAASGGGYTTTTIELGNAKFYAYEL